jgi:hypothetical protein
VLLKIDSALFYVRLLDNGRGLVPKLEPQHFDAALEYKKRFGSSSFPCPLAYLVTEAQKGQNIKFA